MIEPVLLSHSRRIQPASGSIDNSLRIEEEDVSVSTLPGYMFERGRQLVQDDLLLSSC